MQRLLSTFGISSRIYNVHPAARALPVHRQGRRRPAYQRRRATTCGSRRGASSGSPARSASAVAEAGVAGSLVARADQGLLRRRHDGPAGRAVRRGRRAHLQPVRAAEPLVRRQRCRRAELLRISSPRQQRLQSGLDQPAELPRRRRSIRRRGLYAHRRGGVHRPGDPGRAGRLPDRADRRDDPGLPSARLRLRQPRCPADGARPAVRLRRGPGVGGGDHVADGGHGLRSERPDRVPGGPVRRLRRE